MVGKNYRLLSVLADPKTSKSVGLGYLTGILYLSPHTEAIEHLGYGFNLCPNATKVCSTNCLYYQGRGHMNNVKKARLKKTDRFFQDRDNFIKDLYDDINRLVDDAQKLGLKPAIRLNGTSDIPWEKYINMEAYGHVQFYDYTKIWDRIWKWYNEELPSNYHLTLSLEPSDDEYGYYDDKTYQINRAIVIPKNIIYTSWTNSLNRLFLTINDRNIAIDYNHELLEDGDKHDLTFLHDKKLLLLKAKGSYKKVFTDNALIATSIPLEDLVAKLPSFKLSPSDIVKRPMPFT